MTSNHHFIFAKPRKKFNEICYDFALLELIRQFKVTVCIGKGWVISLWVENVRASVVCGFVMNYLKKKYLENLKKIVGAVLELPAK